MKLTYMRTVDLARALNLSVQQVRSPEAWGFLQPVERSAHGYRLFTEHHLRALKTARALIAASYSWQIAADIMKAVHRGEIWIGTDVCECTSRSVPPRAEGDRYSSAADPGACRAYAVTRE